MDVPSIIELGLQTFIDQVDAAYADLDEFSSDALAWICREHFVLASAKPTWFEGAAACAAQLDSPVVAPALAHQARLATDQAQRYFAVLEQTRLDPLLRIEFAPTTSLVERATDLFRQTPSAMLGAVLVVERLQTFEHQLFGQFTRALHDRRVLSNRGLALLDFHLHASHAAPRPLGAFLEHVPSEVYSVEATGPRPTIAPHEAIQGGLTAIELHLTWWQNLLPVSLEKSAPLRVS